MPYHLHISDTDRAYLDGLPLSWEAKKRIAESVEEFLVNVSDDFRLDPENRPHPDKPYFLVRHLILDQWGDGRMHTIDFHVRDDSAPFGVLLIVFIDHH